MPVLYFLHDPGSVGIRRLIQLLLPHCSANSFSVRFHTRAFNLCLALPLFPTRAALLPRMVTPSEKEHLNAFFQDIIKAARHQRPDSRARVVAMIDADFLIARKTKIVCTLGPSSWEVGRRPRLLLSVQQN
jgi:hypothetical protein